MITIRQFALEKLAEPLDSWKAAVRLLHQEFDPEQITQRWIDGLRVMKVAAEQAKDGGETLEFGLEFPCPVKEHRSADGMRRARIRLRIEDDGWVTMIGPPIDGKDHTDTLLCRQCSQDSIENWLITCSRCVADEESDDHRKGHSLGWEYGSRSPLDYVLGQISRVIVEAANTWLDRYPEEAIDRYLEATGDADFDHWEEWEYASREEAVEVERAKAREALKEWAVAELFYPYLLEDGENPLAVEPPRPKAKPSGSRSGRQWPARAPSTPRVLATVDDAIAYLDLKNVPKTAGVREAVAMVEKEPDCPPIGLVKRAQPIRSGRSRVPSS